MEHAMYEDLSYREGTLGSVVRIYSSGFDLVMKDGRFLHFQNEDRPLSPFSAILDRPVRNWRESVSLQVEEVLCKKGNTLFREESREALIDLGETDRRDLRAPILSIAADDEINRWIALLCDVLCTAGHFDGLGGCLVLLRKDMPSGYRSCLPVVENLWIKKAIPLLSACLGGLRREERGSFETLWNGLLGLGPGLTTSGDDFLVGFMSVHRFLFSPLVSIMDGPGFREELKQKAKIKTNEVGYQFLSYALDGMFSENMHHLFVRLMDRADEEAMRRYVTDCIHWGHSSGTDIMTGIIFGLETLKTSKGNQDGLDSIIRN